MATEYTSVDGQRVEVTVARAFRDMAAEFLRVFGMTLHVRSGTRTKVEQWRLYDGWIRRLPGFNLAAHPDDPLAYHVETNPQGPRALDLYDSGNDAGVTTVGTHRNNWIRDNCHRWGFTHSGLTFRPKEGWHIHFTQPLGSSGAGGDGGQWPARTRYGHDWVAAAQKKLAVMGLYAGEFDGKDGPDTQSGTRQLQAAGGLGQDGIFGPQTNTLADLILAGHNQTQRADSEIQRVVGTAIDNEWGGKTSLAAFKWQKANGLTADAIWGAASDAKAFPPTPNAPGKNYPTDGRNITSRLTKDIQTFLIGKGFDLGAHGADGDYGQKTSVAAAMYQESAGLDVDGIWGNATDAKAFPGTPPPGAEAPAKERTPTYPNAAAGWDVPLGRTPRDPGSIITQLIIHHETALSSQVGYFERRNERGSCPTWEAMTDGRMTEMMNPAMRPSATGSANTYSVAVETTNTSVGPMWGISEASHEAIAQLAAWLSQQTSFDGVPVRIKLDREHIVGHNETPPGKATGTLCPGPSMHLDKIVARARAIVAGQQTPPPSDTVPVDRTSLQSVLDKLKNILGGAK